MPEIRYRGFEEADLPFLFQVYAYTRLEELAQTGWSDEQVHQFLVFQFEAQHKHYQQHYSGASFDLILLDEVQAGRLYIHRQDHDIRIIDIALLPPFRRQGLGRKILRQILDEGTAKQTRVSIHVEENNPAIRLYERLGFVRGDRIGVYLYMEATPETYAKAKAALDASENAL